MQFYQTVLKHLKWVGELQIYFKVVWLKSMIKFLGSHKNVEGVQLF